MHRSQRQIHITTSSSPFEVIRESESGEDGVFARECYEARRGESPVGVYPRERKPQRVFLAGFDASVTTGITNI